MGEKKMVKVSLGSLIFLFIVVILISVIAGMLGYFYTHERFTKNNSVPVEKSSEAKKQIVYGKEYKSPKFYYDSEDKALLENSENWEPESYIFEENGNVKYYTYESVLSGTYELLSDGTIKIRLDYLYNDLPGGNREINYETELKIMDNNTIIGSTLEKNDASASTFFYYWSPYKVVYSLDK